MLGYWLFYGLGYVLFRCFGFWVVFWIAVWTWWVALFRDCCIDCWEVLCVLRDLLVDLLGGLRNGVKA